MTDLNDVVSQLAALNAAFAGSPQQQPAWHAPSTAMVPAQAAPYPAPAPSMNVGALLQAVQQLGAAQASQEPLEAPFVDELRQVRASVATLSQQLEALAQAMQLMVRQVGMALARPPQVQQQPQLPRSPPLPQQPQQQRTMTMARLPLVDPEQVRLLDDEETQSTT